MAGKTLDVATATAARPPVVNLDRQKRQVLANTAWALATLKQPDVKLVTVLTRAAEWQVRELNSQNFANTAWACATLKQPDEKPFTSIHGLGVGG